MPFTMSVLRTISWLMAIASVIAVVARYDSLPDEFPVSRWTTAAKTPFLALRIPLINLASLALVELLTANLRKAATAMPRAERNLYFCMFSTVTAKTLIETLEIICLESLQMSVFMYGLVVAVLAGLSAAGYCFLQIEPTRRKTLFNTNRSTNILMGLLIVAILILNLPLIGVSVDHLPSAS